MIRKALLIILLLCCFLPVASSAASSLDHNIEQGNKYYTDGDLQAAIAEYEKVITAGYESAQLYYNLGNAYFRDGQLGLAIMNYVRAKRLAPRDEDIQANLEFAHRFAVDRIEVTEQTIVLDFINKFFDSFTLNEITVIAAVLYVLTMCLLLLRFIYRKIYIPMPVFSVVVLLFIIAAVFTGVKVDRDVLVRQGVVLVQETEIKSGPGEDFNTKFSVHAGLMFNIEREEAGYYWVNFENRLKGWIQKSAAAEI